MTEGVKIKGDHKIGTAQGSAGMATLALVDHADDVAPYLAGNALEFLNIRHDLKVGLSRKLKKKKAVLDQSAFFMVCTAIAARSMSV